MTIFLTTTDPQGTENLIVRKTSDFTVPSKRMLALIVAIYAFVVEKITKIC